MRWRNMFLIFSYRLSNFSDFSCDPICVSTALQQSNIGTNGAKSKESVHVSRQIGAYLIG